LVVRARVPSSPILITLMKEALSSSETTVLTRAIRCNILEDAILNSHRSENLKSYKVKSPCGYLIKQCVMKAYWGLDVRIHVFLTSVLVGVERSASRPCRYIPGRAHGTHGIGDKVNPTAGLATQQRRTAPVWSIRKTSRVF
jgi:hypothetical protein